MVGQIDDCILIAYSPVINAKFIVICQGVGYLRVQAPRIILLSIRADVFQLQLVFSACCRVPDDLVKSPRSAVEVVRAIVGRQLIINSVQLKLPIGNAVSIAPDYCSKK